MMTNKTQEDLTRWARDPRVVKHARDYMNEGVDVGGSILYMDPQEALTRVGRACDEQNEREKEFDRLVESYGGVVAGREPQEGE